MDSTLKERLDFIFKKTNKIFSDLKEKYEKISYEPTIDEIFDFQISSNASSLTFNTYKKNNVSFSSIICMRTILEALSLKKLFKDNVLKKSNEDLLKSSWPILEYNGYKRFDEYINVAQNFRKNYIKARQYYKDYLQIKKGSILNYVVDSNIPFVFECETTFSELVEKAYGSLGIKYYTILSTLTHPFDYNELEGNILEEIFEFIISLLEEEYKDEINDEISLDETISLFSTLSEIKELVSTFDNVSKSIEHVYKSYEKDSKSYGIVNTLQIFKDYLDTIKFDFILFNNPVAKEKWKPFFELYANNKEIFLNHHCDWREYNLFSLHSKNHLLHLSSEKNNVKSNEIFSLAYKLYLDLYPKGVSFQKFKTLFNYIRGYSINELGIIKSMDDTLISSLDLTDSVETNTKLKKTFLTDYIDSQLLSHANGYYFYANKEASGNITKEITNIIICISSFAEEIENIYFSKYNETKDYEFKKRSNEFKKISRECKIFLRNINNRIENFFLMISKSKIFEKFNK